MNIETSFVQNGLELSKGNEGKSFSEFPVFGGSIRLDSSLTGGGSTKSSKGEEAMDTERKDEAFFLHCISP